MDFSCARVCSDATLSFNLRRDIAHRHLLLDLPRCLDAISRHSGVYLIPGGLFFVFATSWEFSSLIHHLVPFRRLEIACLSCGVFLGGCAPILHQLFLARPYPPDCPVGVVGMVLVIAMVSMSWSSLRMLQDFTRRPETCLSTWAFASLVPLYVGGGASFWVLIRWFSVPTWGLWALSPSSHRRQDVGYGSLLRRKGVRSHQAMSRN